MTKQSLSSKAGLNLSVAQIRRKLRKHENTRKKSINPRGVVYLTAVIEASVCYLIREAAELAKSNAKEKQTPYITPAIVRNVFHTNDDARRLMRLPKLPTPLERE